VCLLFVFLHWKVKQKSKLVVLVVVAYSTSITQKLLCYICQMLECRCMLSRQQRQYVSNMEGFDKQIIERLIIDDLDSLKLVLFASVCDVCNISLPVSVVCYSDRSHIVSWPLPLTSGKMVCWVNVNHLVCKQLTLVFSSIQVYWLTLAKVFSCCWTLCPIWRPILGHNDDSVVTDKVFIN